MNSTITEINQLIAHANEVRKATMREVAAAENRARAAVQELDQALAEGGTEYCWDGEKKSGRARPPQYLATYYPLGWRDPQGGTAQGLQLRVCHDMGYTTSSFGSSTRQAPRQAVTGEVDGVRYQNGVCIEQATWYVMKQGSRHVDSRSFYVCDAHLDAEHNPHLHAARSEPARPFPASGP
jgi:hypothetical protein